MDKMKMQTNDLADENFKKLKELFPNAVTETIDENGEVVRAIDKDVLRQEINAQVVDGPEERYQFTWPEKRDAIRQAASSITSTLRPCREKSVNFDTTENVYIEGDNLEVLKLLRETYLGMVKMIYIDPPYNTGNDFIYEDDFSENTNDFFHRDKQYDNQGNRLVQNTESNGRFHTDWLNMMYPRLKVAKDLLANEGVIFISIDDNEQANLKKICDDVFGPQNFIANLIWKSKSGGANDSKYFAVDHEYILAYAKHLSDFFLKTDLEATVTTSYNRSDEKGEYALDRLDKQSIRYSPSLDYEIIGPDGKSYYPQHKDKAHPNATWRWSQKKVQEHYNELVFAKGCVYTKNYKKEGAIPRSLLLEDRFGRTRTGKTDCFALFNQDLFSNPKPYRLIRFLETIATDSDSIILDFFSGSATAAHATMQLNAEDGGKRKFIMVQLPEECEEDSEAMKVGYANICEIGEERIRRAGKKIKEENPMTAKNLDIGFRVFKLDSSNMKDVYYSPAETPQADLLGRVDNIKEGRTPEDLLFQVMLEFGIPLSSKIKESVIAGKKVFNVEENYLIACFDDAITEETITAIAKEKPQYVVLRDSGFKTDSVAANFEQIFATYSPDTTRRIL